VRKLTFAVALLVSAGPCLAAAATDGRAPVVLRGQGVRVEVTRTEGRLRERFLARGEEGWVEVATAGDGGTSAVSIVGAGGAAVPARVASVAVVNGSLVEELVTDAGRVARRLSIVGDGPWVRVVTRLAPRAPLELHAFADRFTFSHPPAWSFSPSVGGFNPDAQYKAPLVLVQAERKAFGIVPDLTALHREELLRCPHALRLDLPSGPIVSVGFTPARLESHSVYGEDTGRTWKASAPVENAYYLLVTATAPPALAYRQAVRFHWERFGRNEQARAAGQQAGTSTGFEGLALWDDWRRRVWDELSPREWLTVPLPDGSVGGGVRTDRWGGGPSIYLGSWFNTLRTSYAMALYARRARRPELLALASQTVRLGLLAPGRDGAFKCIAVPRGNGAPVSWAAGDGSGGSTEQGFLGYDMSWTAYWLLRWRAAGLPGGEGILPRCQRLADFFIERQQPDGSLPTRFAEDGSVQADLSRTVKAETGPVALFLLELHAQCPRPEYWESAKRGLAFLEQAVVPTRQWYDYETFWSCSPREARFDERTGQWPANDLALLQAVAAYLRAYQVSGERPFLERGEELLDYLLLYQQSWTNPALADLSGPAMLLGGFTTQNSDAEWSDARQSQCGNVLVDYYRATGKAEYLERGVAALRAQFPVSPSENWAHEGRGGRAGVSSFHWGTGSGMAGIELAEEELGDAVVDVAAGRGVGVNGLDLTGCNVAGDSIRFSLSSPFRWSRQPVVLFRAAGPSKSYRLIVNGAALGTYTGEVLAKGVPVPLSSSRADARKAPAHRREARPVPVP
jgi:hypothetical protein